MGDSRAKILSRISQSTEFRDSGEDLVKVFERLCDQPSELVQPNLGNSILEVFIQEAKTKSSEIHRLKTLEEVPTWLAQKGEQINQKTPIILSPEFQNTFQSLPPFAVRSEVMSEVKHENSWGLCRGLIGIAETGTIVSHSQACPSGMLFLVERLLVIINISDIVAFQEDAWLKLRSEFPDRQPRTINLITGPSRTADVEQHIQLGAHGPRWVDYIIIG